MSGATSYNKKNPFVLRQNLKEGYGNQKCTILPQAHYDWLHMRLQDFKLISEHNFAFLKLLHN
jgi:hypothetical protein